MMQPHIETTLRFTANHLWQSTLTACLAGALVVLLRSSEARLRHTIWMAASLKFFIPFALLQAMGARFAATRVLPSPAPVLNTVLNIGQPFAGTATALHANASTPVPFPWFAWIAAAWALGALTVTASWILRWRRVSVTVRVAVPQQTGRESDALRAALGAAGIERPLPLLFSKATMEPGVFGIFRPVLLWPEGISAHLDDEQLAAIVAHEVCHVKRRDNLLALLHMAVEAAFWFHPLVWWMGGRLLEERERACDEAVLREGNQPAPYADAILKACRFSIESPLTCVSGVSGSDLKKRMVRIMNLAVTPLSRSRKMLLASIAVATVAGPIAMGALNPHVVRADEAQDAKYAGLHFTSASLTPSQPGSQNTVFMMGHNDQIVESNVTMKDLIAVAHGVRPDRIVGGPDWINTEHFDFEAHWTPTPETKSEVPPPPPPAQFMARTTFRVGSGAEPSKMTLDIPAPAPLQAMLRNYLAEHAGLQVRSDSEVQPVYELVVANGGVKLTPTRYHEALPPGVTYLRSEKMAEAHPDGEVGQQKFAVSNGEPRLLCYNLSARLGREVVDKTGLTGRYDFEMSFPAQADSDQLASILRDQYGLDLQQTQQPVKVFAVDNIQIPQTN